MNCNIIKDLMVLYASGECSDESKAAIMEHMATCPGCKAIWETMEAGELEAACEEEKETEFQQVTKEIKKRNWRRIFKRTVACTLTFVVFLFVAGIIYVRYDNAGLDDVITGNIVYWNEDDQRENKDVLFQYEGENYLHLNPDEDIGLQLFGGKARPYFRFSTNWEELLKNRRNAVFNVQSEWASPWADLILENNRVTMYAVEADVEENMYIDTRECDLFVPLTSRKQVLSYYNDESNYTWSLSEVIDVPMSDPNPAKNIKKREGLNVGFTSVDVKKIEQMLKSDETISVKEDYSKLHYVNLHMISKDGVMGCHMSVENIDGKWYALGESYYETNGDLYDNMLPLPKSIGDKIDKALEQ